MFSKSCISALGLIIVQSCATSQESIYAGLGVGSVIGGSIGAIVGQSHGNPRNGAIAGAAIGGAIGGVAGHHKFKEDSKLERQIRFQSNFDQSVPGISIPKIKKIWVPDQIDGDKYIAGHFIYVIDRQSSWKLSGESEGNPAIDQKNTEGEDPNVSK